MAPCSPKNIIHFFVLFVKWTPFNGLSKKYFQTNPFTKSRLTESELAICFPFRVIVHSSHSKTRVVDPISTIEPSSNFAGSFFPISKYKNDPMESPTFQQVR